MREAEPAGRKQSLVSHESRVPSHDSRVPSHDSRVPSRESRIPNQRITNMKILGISGSPRKKGNTETLLDAALKKAAGAEIKKIIISDLNISPCREEEYSEVSERGFSIVNDDMSVIFDAVTECDAIIIASPIFFGSLSAQMKTMIDRFQCVWISKNIQKKDVYPKRLKGAFLCASASRRQDFFDNASSIIKHFFATINAEYKEELFCPGLDTKGSVKNHPECLKAAGDIGERLARG